MIILWKLPPIFSCFIDDESKCLTVRTKQQFSVQMLAIWLNSMSTPRLHSKLIFLYFKVVKKIKRFKQDRQSAFVWLKISCCTSSHYFETNISATVKALHSYVLNASRWKTRTKIVCCWQRLVYDFNLLETD